LHWHELALQMAGLTGVYIMKNDKLCTLAPPPPSSSFSSSSIEEVRASAVGVQRSQRDTHHCEMETISFLLLLLLPSSDYVKGKYTQGSQLARGRSEPSVFLDFFVNDDFSHHHQHPTEYLIINKYRSLSLSLCK
jgi:hypothetical protein